MLVEQDDLASGTSSASSKLVHGGLRYLEQFEFGLVAEALAEREVLLRIAPHLVRPMRFVIPHVQAFRPAWVIRAGLLLYDALARHRSVPRSAQIDLRREPFSAELRNEYDRGYAYWDCWVDDSRLVIANARDAADRGARILPRTSCVSVCREGSYWRARLQEKNSEIEIVSRAVVNATGAWAARFLYSAANVRSQPRLRLVQGSHIIVPRVYTGTDAFVMQNDDGRIVFIYPYENEYTLIGTTEVELTDVPQSCRTTAEEIDYLCRACERYFACELRREDVVWSYCGVRALADDGARNPSKVTREYALHVETSADGGPLLSVLGGKITTYRRLAERALEKLAPWFGNIGRPWTSAAALPGGTDLHAGETTLIDRYPDMPPALLSAVARRHGSVAIDVLGNARTVNDLGIHFGESLYSREIDYFIDREWAQAAEDVLWRRSKIGLHLSPDQQGKVRDYIARRLIAV